MAKIIGIVDSCFAALLVAGCARSAVLPISADMIQITTSAAPICGATGAQNVALRRAAIETINRGFDRFLILGTDTRNTVGVVGYTPTTATTNVSGSTSSTTISGGYPIFAGTHDQGLLVKMFKDSDPVGGNAISARATLGNDWENIAKENLRTTC